MSSTAGLVREYRDRTPASAAAFEAAKRVMPGGETRSVTTYPPYPVIITEGQGAACPRYSGSGSPTPAPKPRCSRADLLELTVAASTPGNVSYAGTFNGHLAAAVAGAVTLRYLDAGA